MENMLYSSCLLAFILLLLTGNVLAGELKLEPPLDPISGFFSATACWSGNSFPPEVFSLLKKKDSGKMVWHDKGCFSPRSGYYSTQCNTTAFPDGLYTLQVEAQGQKDQVTIRLRQGRSTLSNERPFQKHLIWMPMTGWTEQQIDDAVAAGYDTVFAKVHPMAAPCGVPLDYNTGGDDLIRAAQKRGMKIIVAWLLWTGLPADQFYLQCRDGHRLPGRIDPCWDAAMRTIRVFSERLLAHYSGCADIIGIVPTWGIYGEAGYAAFDGGYSPWALEKFNRWRIAHGYAPLKKLPLEDATFDGLLFHRFRFEYNTTVWGELNAHLRNLEPNGIAVGAWQEIYNGYMYSLALNEVPGADFALNEMAFPWGTTRDQLHALGETMGFRFKCDSAQDFRDYYLPLIARKWAEGQQAIGCQLSCSYAEKNYKTWPREKARAVKFDQWEDQFASSIRRVCDTPVLREPAEVACIQMTYPAAVYPDRVNTITDINLYEIVLRMYGIEYDRIPFDRLPRVPVKTLQKYKILILPDAWYLDTDIWRKLRAARVPLLLTGGVMQASDDGLYPDGTSRVLAGMKVTYGKTSGGDIRITSAWSSKFSLEGAYTLPPDIGICDVKGGICLVAVGGRPLLVYNDKCYLVTNRLLYACAYDPNRVIPSLSGSDDASANENDPWGYAASDAPANKMGEQLLRNILQSCGVLIRIPHPLPRHYSRYLGDHVERISVTQNIVVNTDAQAHTVEIHTYWPVKNFPCLKQGTVYSTMVTVGPYDFVALEPVRAGRF